MGEEQRQRAAYQTLEQLLEPEPRTLQQVWVVSQPLSGEEFEQVAEERALAGFCGSPMCMKPLSRAAAGKLRRKLYQSTYCSTACELAVAELVRGLGPAEAARRRFSQPRSVAQPPQQPEAPPQPPAPAQPGLRPGFLGAAPKKQPVPSEDGQQQQQQRQRRRQQQQQAPQQPQKRPASKFRKDAARKKSQQPEAGARGGGVTVMSATVQERTPAAAPMYTGFEEITEPAAQLSQPAEQDAVMGDVAERAPWAPPGAEPDAVLGEVMEREPRPPQDAEQDAVTGDVVERLSTQQPQRGTHGRVTFADDVRGGDDEAPAAKRQLPGRVSAAMGRPEGAPAPQQPVLVLDMEGGANGADPSTLGFARLQVKEASEMPGAVHMVQNFNTAGAAQPVSRPDPVLGDVAERPMSLAPVTERPIIGEVVDRQPGAAAERQSPAAAAAQAGAPVGGGGRPKRRAPGGAAAAGPDARLQASLAEINARLEAELAESGSDDGNVDDASVAESEDSEQSAFGSLNMAAALDVEASDDEDARGTMPQPFARLSHFGQLYTALDNWVTRATLNYVQGEELARQPMDMEQRQRCAVFLRHVVGCLPALGRTLALTAPRASLETPLRELATTLDFTEPLASLPAGVWEVAGVVLLKALSLRRVPALRPALESREGVVAVSAALAARGLTEELFACLLEVLCPEDV